MHTHTIKHEAAIYTRGAHSLSSLCCLNFATVSTVPTVLLFPPTLLTFFLSFLVVPTKRMFVFVVLLK